MIHNINTDKILTKDGTSQQDRKTQAIQADAILVDDRNIKDLIEEAQRLAQELQFFNDTNTTSPGQTWELFLIEDAISYQKESGLGKQILREQWASQLATYVEDPERFAKDAKKRNSLSKPHVVLFMAFLKLLHHIKSQINGLTQKHLDFYFNERLGLNPKKALPDVVNVLLELAENREFLEVQKGMLLQAGEDGDGNELQYQVDEDTIISKAQITALKNVYVEKQLLTIAEAHRINMDHPDTALIRMFEIAVGHPYPGNTLPEFPIGIEDIFQLNIEVSKEDPVAINYVTHQLFLSIQDFEFILKLNQDDKNGIPADWESVYGLLDQAHKEKQKVERQQVLQGFHENISFDHMTKQVYGNPDPGDNLPLYNGRETSLDLVLEDLQSDNAESNQLATAYIQEELKLKEQDFILIVQIDTNSSPIDRQRVYAILEQVDRQIKSIILTSPTVEKFLEIYDTPDAREFTFSEYGDEEESKRFRTLGNNKYLSSSKLLKPSEIGFAISSPTLMLKEGIRMINVFLDIRLKDSHVTELQENFERINPFQIYLSGNEEWFIPDEVSYTIGNYVGLESESIEIISIDDLVITIPGTSSFTNFDIGKYIVDSNKSIYKIVALNTAQKAAVQLMGPVNSDNSTPQKYTADQVYLNALAINIVLQQDDPAVTAFDAEASPSFVHAEHPSLVGVLHPFLKDDQNKDQYSTQFESLANLKLHKTHLYVAVEEIKNIIIQNDQNTIDPKKPFEPFGFSPTTGSNLYFAHEEISAKKLQHFNLDMQWIKAPESFKEHYRNYWIIDEDNPVLSEDQYGVVDNNDFKATVFFHDKNTEVSLSDQSIDADGTSINQGFPLFAEGGKINISNLPARMKVSTPNYTYKQHVNGVEDEDEALGWDRYFRLELDPLDFQHELYTTLFARQVLSEKTEVKNKKINPPYEPKLRKLTLGYTAYTDIIPLQNEARDSDSLYHIHPFGFDQVDINTNPGLLPKYLDEGTLFLGIDQLIVPQTLAILFQIAEGSANPDVEKPELQWSYLRHNEWIAINPSAIIFDSTNGLLNTGIIKIQIPEDATTGKTLMSDALHWLKVGVYKNSTGISDTIAIKSQVISATLSTTDVAASHFEHPLPVDTIKETSAPFLEIAAVNQPFTSSKGKAEEQGALFYTRLSERLRHKNRALTMWDYEHMVLNQFPQIYKVKCLPSKTQLGTVELIVLPDIKGKLPFNPFAPKVGADTLFQIQEYLNKRTPAFAEVTVTNPFYLQVSSECVVKFHKEFDAQFYKEKLINEIKRFMSPWAYDKHSDIHIGGTFHASVLINFIAERPYVDYVANLKLFQSEDGITYTDVRSVNDGKSVVIPYRPDMIMVSAASHEIYIATEGGFDQDSFEGVGYMEISKDFEVT